MGLARFRFFPTPFLVGIGTVGILDRVAFQKDLTSEVFLQV